MKFLTFSILTVVIFFTAAYFYVNGTGASDDSTTTANNMTIENGVQIIGINAKGGYQPRTSIAKAGMPTIIRFNTSGTFDCSAAVRIPSLGISRTLPFNGKTDIDVGTPNAVTLKGSCGMGMYRFEVDFRG